MLKCKWISTTITSNAQANQMLKQFDKLKPTIGAFDTETTGLNIGLDIPFLFQFGYLHPTEMIGYTYAVDIEKQPNLAHQVIKAWHKRAKTLSTYLGHNVKYDLHMLANINEPYLEENLSDTMFYIRYAHDAVTEKYGGPSLGLKDYASKFIDHRAKYHEQKVAQERTAIAKQLNSRLIANLKQVNKIYTKKYVEELFKDKTLEINELPQDFQDTYNRWFLSLPIYLQNEVDLFVESSMIRYNALDRKTVTEYSHYDIVLTLETYLKTKPTIDARENNVAIEIENGCILPFYEMEATGFCIDVEYLKQARIDLKCYIRTIRKQLHDLTGSSFKSGQSELIKTLFESRYGIPLESTGKEELEMLASDLKRRNANEDAIKFIELLGKLRTLEKWYSTYVLRFLKNLKTTDTLYTQINQVGPVSGRVSSDFQQFPKDSIVNDEGVEIFNPRKMVKVPNDESILVYLDYSQIELRFQAMYTILVGHPDTNLCRAYMPYKCVDENDKAFDYTNINDIKSAYTTQWFLEENKSKWKPLDVHGATTKLAFDIDETHPDFHHLRYKGKRINFAKNYGATIAQIRRMFPEYSEEQLRKIDNAYYLAFPGVKQYHSYCYARADYYSYTVNLFGVKYYGVSGHKLINMLIQGSSAFYLKLKIIAIYKFLKENNLKTRMQMQIHDELSFVFSKVDSLKYIYDIQHIMQDWEDALVPIVADLEVSKTKWSDKIEMGDLNELQIYIGS